MAFLIDHLDATKVPPHEQLPAGAITPQLGLALVVDAATGMLAVATGTTKPTYICMTQSDVPVAKGTMIPVFRVHDDIVFETVATAALADVTIGSKLTISADGLSVTATTGGAAELVYKASDDVGAAVSIRFVTPAA